MFKTSCALLLCAASFFAINPVWAKGEALATDTLRIATWNAEHLAYPADTGCRPRSAAEIKAMAAYVESLQADIVAVEEVASIKALEQVFPGDQWQLLMSQRPDSEAYTCRESGRTSTQQKVAFAVRKSIAVQAVEPQAQMALDHPGLRYGLSITVDTADGPLDVLALHLKSGCFVDDYSQADSEACDLFAKQAPVLDAWVEAHEAAGRSYLILGDFNHRLSAPYNRLTRLLEANSDGSDSSLRLLTRDLIGCHPRYPAPIDHIFMGGKLPASVASNAQVHPFADRSEAAMLSDHCAVSVDLFAKQKLSTATRWVTGSKEYRFITRAAYRRAAQTLRALPRPKENWVVVMDVDETVLDNSSYQLWAEGSGRRFSPSTWKTWVESEQATFVPGAREFIEGVLSLGGRVALITNRDKAQDLHTWANLKALGLPVENDHFCLVGRSKADKVAVGQPGIINDKDLRRRQLSEGEAACFVDGSAQPSRAWQKPQSIVMQVGDNIQDIGGVTQAKADVDALLQRLDVVILPNPVYGSW